jgi:hypothetical protein
MDLDQSQRMLNWLEKEKTKDNLEVSLTKQKFVNEIRQIDKTKIFKKEKPISLWQRIKIMILGT